MSMSAVEHMEKVVDRFEPHEDRRDRTELSIGKLNLKLSTKEREITIGYQYEEWVLRPGRRLYVLGEAGDSSGGLWIAWVSNKGRSWVRVAATVLGVLSIVVGLFVIVFGDLWPIRLVMIAPVTVAVVVLVLLERPESRR